jgi:hypothetical protein
MKNEEARLKKKNIATALNKEFNKKNAYPESNSSQFACGIKYVHYNPSP